MAEVEAELVRHKEATRREISRLEAERREAELARESIAEEVIRLKAERLDEESRASQKARSASRERKPRRVVPTPPRRRASLQERLDSVEADLDL
jgi:hypothetical protein